MAFSTFVGHGLIHTAATALHPVTASLNMLGNAAFPLELPSVEEIFDLYRRGWVNEVAVDQFARMQGVYINLSGTLPGPAGLPIGSDFAALWRQRLEAGQELPTLDQFLDLTNRGCLADHALPKNLKLLGYTDPLVISCLSNLRYEIPGSSDLVRFSVRHVFEPDLIARLGYNEEFRPILDMWHRFQGLNYPIFSGPFADQVKRFEAEIGLSPGAFIQSYAEQGLSDPTWAQAFWWSHWVLPSPTQGYEMYFRLRPDRDRRFDPEFAKDLNFSLEDLNLLLRANDYPPSYRGALAAIAHRIPGIRFLRQLRATDVFQFQDVVELLLRQGYSPGDAFVLAQAVERNDRDLRRKTVEQLAKGQLAKYWELGTIDRDEYVSLLVKHGLTPQDAADTAQLAEIDLGAQRVKGIISYVKKQVIKGAVNRAEAGQMLLQAGVVGPRVEQYLDDWSLEVRAQHREISAQQAVQLSCKGLIDLPELRVRLANLGYADQDSALLAQEAELCQQARATRAAAQAARAEQGRISQLKRQQRELAQGIQASRRQLAAHGSPSQLRKWYCEGHLGQTELYQRLAFLGWPPADIDRLIGDCKSGTPGAQQRGKSGATGAGQSAGGATQTTGGAPS